MMKECKGFEEHGRTIWKICRALCNPLRLEMMKFIYLQQRNCCVTDIAGLFEIPIPVASIYLNQLCSAGLIGAERDHVKVYFMPWQRGNAPTELCRALHDIFKESPPEWKEYLMTRVKAFTHPNRLAMLLRLMKGEATVAELKKSAGKCVKTMRHHLLLLNSAGLIVRRRRFHQPMLLSIRIDGDPINSILLSMLDYESQFGCTFYNDAPDRGLDGASRHVLRKIARSEESDWTRIKIQKGKSLHLGPDILNACDEEED